MTVAFKLAKTKLAKLESHLEEIEGLEGINAEWIANEFKSIEESDKAIFEMYSQTLNTEENVGDCDGEANETGQYARTCQNIKEDGSKIEDYNMAGVHICQIMQKQRRRRRTPYCVRCTGLGHYAKSCPHIKESSVNYCQGYCKDRRKTPYSRRFVGYRRENQILHSGNRGKTENYNNSS